MAGKGLTPNQERFVEEYLKDLNGARAYREAYPNTRGDLTARTNASKLLTNANVAAKIAAGQAKRAERTHIEQDRVLLEIARLAFSDPRRAFNPDGSLKPIHSWPDEVAASISSIKVKRVIDTDGPVEVSEVKFWDKNSALEKCGKHLGLFNERLHLVSEPLNEIAEIMKASMGTALRPGSTESDG